MSKHSKGKPRDSGLSSDMYDEVDTFMEKRNQSTVSLPNGKKFKKGKSSIDGSRTMMDLDISESDSNEDYDDVSENSSISGSEDNGRGFDGGKWGSKKHMYHQAREEDEVSDLSGSDVEDIAEEAEALRMQRRKAAERRDDDFDDSFAKRASTTKKTSSKAKNTITSSDAGLLESMYKDLNSAAVSSSLVAADGRDLSALSKQEKLDLITKDSPELLLLLDSFTAKIQEIRERLEPLIQRARAHQIPTTKGLSYLETKYHLLLNYCTNVCFYLLLKAEGKSVKNHPVIEHLARLRTVIDRLKPLDQKLKYQVDKLLKAAVQGQENDPNLRHKANIKGFVPLDKEDDDGDESGLEDEEEEAANTTGKYVVPKFTSATSKEERQRKLKEKKAKTSAMAQYLIDEFGDRPLEHDYSTGIKDKALLAKQQEREAFEEEHFVRLGTSKKEKKAMRDAAGYVDELKDLADFGDLETLDYHDHQNALDEAEELEAKALSSKKRKKATSFEDEDRLAAVMDSIDQRAAAASSKSIHKRSMDEDIDYEAIRQSKKAKKPKLQEFAPSISEDKKHRIDKENREKDEAKQQEASKHKKGPAASEAMEDDDDFYKEAAALHEQQKAAKKQEKEARKAAKQQQASDEDMHDESEEEGEYEEEGDGHRRVTGQIDQNKGLRKYKAKEKRNSRVKGKTKYAKALKNLKGRGRTEIDRNRIFTGDAPGINKRVVRSTAL